MKKEEKLILGVMSGTSLDGLDFALCRFYENEGVYSHKIIKTGFVSYDEKKKSALSNAQNLNAFEFIRFHKKYGKYIGQELNIFLKNEIKPEYIASHGHTIFHKPDENLTFQIGDAAFIAAETNISVISDFRNLDTALNGQGAPLVPIGDKFLFSEYDFCINLGGFANVSYEEKGRRVAYDICPVNFVLNNLVQEFNLEYDKDGNIGKKGKINNELLQQLNDIPYYSEKAPKSLGREYVDEFYYPVIERFKITTEDKIRTFYKHVALQIACILNAKKNAQVLLTGGGTHNTFLISEIEAETKHEIIIPDKETIDFKEAIIFAFLGYLRVNKNINTLKSVTGATKDSIGGSVFFVN